MTSEDKFKLTDKGKEYCKESTVIESKYMNSQNNES